MNILCSKSNRIESNSDLYIEFDNLINGLYRPTTYRKRRSMFKFDLRKVSDL